VKCISTDEWLRLWGKIVKRLDHDEIHVRNKFSHCTTVRY